MTSVKDKLALAIQSAEAKEIQKQNAKMIEMEQRKESIKPVLGLFTELQEALECPDWFKIEKPDLPGTAKLMLYGKSGVSMYDIYIRANPGSSFKCMEHLMPLISSVSESTLLVDEEQIYETKLNDQIIRRVAGVALEYGIKLSE